ncbi:MAG: PAS domain-containing protein, partial [Deltaproteobacteria bacterium]|nr:PAS domain-containing protein [Deltaproteobacteria bacterium]
IAADMLGTYPRERVFASLVANRQEMLHQLFLVDSRGAVVYSYPEGTAAVPGSALDMSEVIDRASRSGASVLITDFVSFQSGGQRNLSFVLGVPVPGQSAWVCCIPNAAAFKRKFIYPIRSGTTGYAWMIDNRGVLLAHPNKAMEGRKALEVMKELWPEYSAFNLESIINQEMITGEEGSGEYTGWHIGEKRLTKKLVAYSPIAFQGVLWSIGVSVPYREVMAPLMESLVGPVVFICCFVIVIIVGAVMLMLQERRRRSVNQELAWCQEVFDGITDGISIVDRDYRVLMVNQAVSRWQGKPQPFFKGKPCYRVFQQQEDKCQGCPAREAFETGRPAFRERVSTTLGGQKFYFHLTAFPLKDKDGNTIRVVECVKDVTREMVLRAELLQHERTSVIASMAAQVAHEIRNPLGSLTLNVDLLEDEIDNYGGSDTAESKTLLVTIKQELEGLHRVLQEYLECTRFPRIKPGRYDINGILEGLFGLMEEELRRRKITFAASFAYDLPQARVDQDQIRRAFMNIVRNAVEAMDAGGTIAVGTCLAKGRIEVVFQDAGPGIPDDQIEKIFNPFFTTKSGGTGLGLAITQHIITEHKGSVECRSLPEGGAVFVVRLPQWTGEEQEEDEEQRGA